MMEWMFVSVSLELAVEHSFLLLSRVGSTRSRDVNHHRVMFCHRTTRREVFLGGGVKVASVPFAVVLPK